jgi:hypothetical protein
VGHIFISYSHRDGSYAHRLADTIQAEGFDVWIDARLDYGSQWPQEIQKQLDTCDAFILIMTPRSFASDWVQSELQRAKRKLKPIFPLLLEGDEPWLSVESTQYYDVRGERLPDPKFYSGLARVVPRHKGQAVQLPEGNGKTSLHPRSFTDAPKPKTGIAFVMIGAIAVLLTAVLIVWSAFLRRPVVPLTGQATEPDTSPTTVVANPDSVPSELTDDYGVPMSLVPEGEFTMGSDAESALAECQKYSSECHLEAMDDEAPPHKVF